MKTPIPVIADQFDGASPALFHPKEEERLAALLGLQILDTTPDPDLDGLTKIASTLCEVPCASIIFVDRDREWVKSSVGSAQRETSRDVSMSAHALGNGSDLFIIPDTLQDRRFATNPLVSGEPFVRFFAAAPLMDENDLPIGALCISDQKPRELSLQKLECLKDLARTAMTIIRSAKNVREAKDQLRLEKEVYNGLLTASAQIASHAPTFDDALNSLVKHLDPALGWLSARIRNMQTGGTTGIYYNLSIPRDKEVGEIWHKIDATASHPLAQIAHSQFVSSAPLRPEYSYLVVPVRVRDRLVAVLEFLYPDHRRTDQRIRDVFDILAANLSVVAERELVSIELQRQVDHDHLTGAASRPTILQNIANALQIVDPLAPEALLYYIDIDGFKQINDNYGHTVGDQLLIEIARRFDRICRNGDMVGRLSGDEFVLLFRDTNVVKEMENISNRVENTFASSFTVGALDLKVCPSIGCVVLSNPDITPSDILIRAEEAMYLVKTGKRKGVCVVDEELVHEFQRRHKLDRKIRNAVETNRLFLVYQPIVDVQSGKIIGAEALLRFLEKDGSVMIASTFMAALMRTRFLQVVDEWVLVETLQTFSTTARSLLQLPDFRLSVNVSPPILSTTGYAETCLALLETTGVPPVNLTLEIVESDLLLTNKNLLDNLHRLRAKGVRIAVDDFGTGYSNLQYLNKLPIDIIKIDRVFMQGIIPGDQSTNGLLDAIFSIGKNLDFTIIAEGVEDKLQDEYLKSIGCRYAQGYLYAQPMPLQDLLTFAKAHS